MKARAFTRAQRTAWAPERHTSGKEVSRGPPAEPPPHLQPHEARRAKDTQASGMPSALSLRKHLFS